jgi:hypothetical protein
MEFLLIRNGVLHRGGILCYIIPSLLYNMMKAIPETRRAHYILYLRNLDICFRVQIKRAQIKHILNNSNQISYEKNYPASDCCLTPTQPFYL